MQSRYKWLILIIIIIIIIVIKLFKLKITKHSPTNILFRIELKEARDLLGPLKKFIALGETMLVLSRAHKCLTKQG